jgi:uncharacterized protein
MNPGYDHGRIGSATTGEGREHRPRGWHAPSEPAGRIQSVDALRGLAILGVLFVNLQTEFRVSLFTFYSTFHTHPGIANLATDDAIRLLLESKAFAILSFLFGVGMAMFFERGRRVTTSVGAIRLLLRRLFVLAGIGFLHILFWNGDILLAYAITGVVICAWLLVPPKWALGVALLIGVAHVLPLGLPGLPPMAAMVRQGAAATASYGADGFARCFLFRWQETRRFMVPLLVGSLPRIAALSLGGMAAWRMGWLDGTPRRSRLYRVVAASGLLVGGGATGLEMGGLLESSPGALHHVASALASVPLAIGYIALFFLSTESPRWMRWFLVFSPAGRMALTNYLLQSVALSFVFSGYGLGLFGRVSSSHAAAGGLVFAALQVAGSRWWLSHVRFGPAEWVWRRLTFGSGLRRAAAA